MFPSINEGFGLPVIEAMACGTPVITSNVTSLPEIAGDAALVVSPLDIEAIADAMRKVLEDSPLREGLISQGLKRASTFTWDRTAQETGDLYFWLASQNPQ